MLDYCHSKPWITCVHSVYALPDKLVVMIGIFQTSVANWEVTQCPLADRLCNISHFIFIGHYKF